LPADLEALYPEQERQNLADHLQHIYQIFFEGADWQALNASFQSLSLAQLLAGTDFNHGLERLIQTVLTFLDSVKGQYLLLENYDADHPLAETDGCTPLRFFNGPA
jgi:hypothetical protein